MKYLVYCVFHTQKIGTLLCILITLIGAKSVQVNPEWSWLVNVLVLGSIVAILKFICGGWNANSIKGMTWAVIISTVVSLMMVISAVNHGGGSVSFWKWGLPIIVAGTCGICAGKWVDDILTSNYADNLSLDNVVDSIFDKGFSNTFNGFMSDMEADMYCAASRGVAVYTNVLIVISLAIAIFSF